MDLHTATAPVKDAPEHIPKDIPDLVSDLDDGTTDRLITSMNGTFHTLSEIDFKGLDTPDARMKITELMERINQNKTIDSARIYHAQGKFFTQLSIVLGYMGGMYTAIGKELDASATKEATAPSKEESNRESDSDSDSNDDVKITSDPTTSSNSTSSAPNE